MDEPDSRIAEALAREVPLEERLRVVNVRLQLAQTYLAMKRVAFDALLHHGINFRELPAYKNRSLLEDAERLTLYQGQECYVEWCRRVTHDIQAAIRRKQFRKV